MITSGRTAQEVFQHHGQALGSEDLDEIVADYSDAAIFVTRDGTVHGKDGVRKAFADLLGQIPQAAWEIKSAVFEGDLMLLHWAADSENSKIDDGVDTFIFRDGLIVAQTLSATVMPKG